MMCVYFLALFLAVSTALPVEDTIIHKLDPGPRYQYVVDDNGDLHLADMWVTSETLREIARFNPDTDIVYHLYTRQNPTASQPLVFNYEPSVTASNFNSNRRTALVIHGWTNDATSPVNNNIVPAFLEAEDLNVIVVDWNAGAGTINYAAAVINTAAAGASVARFLTWLNSVTGASPAQYHIAGHSLGGQMSGIVSRNMGGSIAYVTALDPAMPGWIINSQTFKPNDAIYTEVIHTNAGNLGFEQPLGQVDFYPNGGKSMPGCGANFSCSHSRAYYYFAESLKTGGFTGRRCDSHIEALTGACDAAGSIKMGGISPKNGFTGAFYLETNEAPLFSQD